MNFNTLVAPGFAGDDADIGFCNPEGFGDKGNQMFVGFAIHRRSSDAQFYTIAQCFCEAVSGSTRLHTDIEQQIITLPLKKHVCPFLVRYETSSYAKSSCSWMHYHITQRSQRRRGRYYDVHRFRHNVGWIRR